MAEIVYMPKLSDTMTEGVVSEWTVKLGDEVSSGEVLAEIETDKATMEFESFYDGVLLHIGVEKGAAAPVNSILAIIGEKGEDVKKILAEAEKSSPQIEKPEKVKEKSADSNHKEKEAEKSAPVMDSKSVPEPVTVHSQKMDMNETNGRVFASPLARKIAKERGIDLNTVSGTGEAGRIVKRDIDNYEPYIGAARNKKAHTGVESFKDEPVSQMRKTIAKRLAESKFTAPHFYLTLDIDMDNAISIRKSMNSMDGIKVSFNDMVLKACGLALREHPKVNSSWLGDVIRVNDHVHIGVAVAVDEGLLVPVVRFADGKDIRDIGAEVKALAQKAKDKKLQPEEWEGNTFTISNLGMFGIEEFTAIINPPDSCIMAVGGIKETPVVKNGQVVAGNIMKITLSCDHRVVDGASGASFLNTFKEYMENPVSLLLS
jgi:pyruvate dehydrogenase E2 component (dihydrolipoamide acetyltransferase)